MIHDDTINIRDGTKAHCILEAEGLPEPLSLGITTNGIRCAGCWTILKCRQFLRMLGLHLLFCTVKSFTNLCKMCRRFDLGASFCEHRTVVVWCPLRLLILSGWSDSCRRCEQRVWPTSIWVRDPRRNQESNLSLKKFKMFTMHTDHTVGQHDCFLGSMYASCVATSYLLRWANSSLWNHDGNG